MHTIKLADSLIEMQKMQRRSIPCICTDPPYNIGTPQRIKGLIGNGRNGVDGKKMQDVGQDFGVFDNDASEPSEWMPLAERVLEKTGVLLSFYGAKKMHHLLNAAEAAGFEIVQDFHWIKAGSPPAMRGVGYAWATESGYVFRRAGEKHKTNREAGHSPNWICRPRNGRENHPTKKRLDVMKWLVKHWTFPGQLVFDPFMGSGSTGVSCVQMGRDFIGFEKREDYFKIAERRLKAANKVEQFFD